MSAETILITHPPDLFLFLFSPQSRNFDLKKAITQALSFLLKEDENHFRCRSETVESRVLPINSPVLPIFFLTRDKTRDFLRSFAARKA
ncbi:hypothetical protein O7047_15815 [Pseudenterobacter timonensis]|uniref:Uncharacterized protein n=1 Tax=Pseudenterobacter timonensis TaxID=1755099 RepID=A0AAE4IWI3_9ENTR|nr:hypothetical protein [Pseudenterobacter timonensis]MDR9891687.1 hypothetical protein [Pseudenterobacter timonensis]